MKGNEAIAHAAIRCGADGYFGYPITPQSEVIETLAELKPWETTGMVVLQAESEVASINMVYGGAAAGKRVLTSSSSPGVALMQEGIAYMAGAEVPGVFVNVRSWSWYYSTFAERLFPVYPWWWQWRLLCHCACTKLCTRDGRLRRPRFRIGFQIS